MTHDNLRAHPQSKPTHKLKKVLLRDVSSKRSCIIGVGNHITKMLVPSILPPPAPHSPVLSLPFSILLESGEGGEGFEIKLIL